MRSPWHEAPRRRAGWFALIAAVVTAHALLLVRLAASVIGWDGAAEPRRIEVSLVKELAPAAPPLVATALQPPVDRPAARPARAGRAARPHRNAAQAASSPAEAASASAQETPRTGAEEGVRLGAGLAAIEIQTADPGQQEVEAAEAAAAAASAASAAAARASGASSTPNAVAGPPRPALDWPPSTRLTYTLTGMYRNGPLYGSSVVEWRREGTHYQVQFDIHVSPFFDQRMFSDGRIADDGLRPQHYDEVRKFPLADPRVRKIEFGDDDVTLGNGTRVARLAQTQDPASQFVQFVWMFATHPQWLQSGNVVEIALALPNNLRRWQYDVGALESLQLPFGAIDAVHLTPRTTGPRRSNEYPFEIWTAPTLQYLPVRIHVQLDEQNYADLALDSRPLQAAPDAPPSPAAGKSP